MSPPTQSSGPAIILDTILGHLAPHFMNTTKGDLPAARHAASQILAAYNTETEEELHLAAEIISFGFHALEALSEAAAPDLTLTKTLRLRGSAVSLSREAHKSQRKLDQLRRARHGTPHAPKVVTPELPIPELPTLQVIAPSDAVADNPNAVQPLGLIELAKEAIQAGTTKGGVQAWKLSRQQRRAAERAAKSARRNSTEHGRWNPHPAAPTAGASRNGAV